VLYVTALQKWGEAEHQHSKHQPSLLLRQLFPLEGIKMRHSRLSMKESKITLHFLINDMFKDVVFKPVTV
jgi:hypothetical protein